MKRISSKLSIAYKLILIPLWLVLLYILYDVWMRGGDLIMITCIVLFFTFMGIMAYFAIFHNVVDMVYVSKNTVFIKKGKHGVIFSTSDIAEAKSPVMLPGRVMVILNKPCQLGETQVKHFIFFTTLRLWPFSTHPIIEELTKILPERLALNEKGSERSP